MKKIEGILYKKKLYEM